MDWLNSEVAKKYKVVGVDCPRFVLGNYGEINLPEMSMAQADDLVSKGFPFLVPYTPAKPAPPVIPQTN